jgi:hypothetical protein
MATVSDAPPTVFTSKPALSIVPGRILLVFARFTWAYVAADLIILIVYAWMLAQIVAILFHLDPPQLQSIGLSWLFILWLEQFLQKVSRSKLIFTKDKIIYGEPLKPKVIVPYTKIDRISIESLFHRDWMCIADRQDNKQVEIATIRFSTSDLQKILRLLKKQIPSVKFNDKAKKILNYS